jgi:hypothetical protein
MPVPFLHESTRQPLRTEYRENEMTNRTKKIVRYSYASNRGDGGNFLSPRQGDFYVQDLLTQQPAETDPKKGWFRKISTVQAAVDKMNAADTGGPYVKLPNGYVTVAE